MARHVKNSGPAAVSSSGAKFRDLVRDYYEESFARFPIWGTGAGRHEFDGELGHPTPATFERQIKLARRVMEAVEDLPASDFEASEMLDRRTFLANLRMELLNQQMLGRWRNNPQFHLQSAADSVFDLLVRHADDLGAVAPAIISRLRKLPRFLDEAAECIERPDPLWQDLTLKAAPGVADLYRSLLIPLARATGRSEASLKKLTEAAAAAALDFAKHVKKARPAPRGSFAIGGDRLTLLIRERLGLALSPREAAAEARKLAAQLNAEMKAEARRFHPTKPAAEILDDAARQWEPEGGSLLEAYARTTQAVRERFEESGWVGFPTGDKLLVRPVPAFMKDQFPTAAYSAPGALDPNQTGIFWVNDLGSKAADEKRRRAEIAQHFGLELTSAHEAYPGHHLQFVHQNRIPSLARKMANHAVYYEGWTLWCEEMTAELLNKKSDNPFLKLNQIHDALWRAWRIVIDVGLQSGDLGFDDACKVLMREVGFTSARAQGDVNWYTAAPTVPMSYLLGKCELKRLKRIKVDLGDWSLREFNDWALSFGAIPWRWIEESGL